MTNHPNRKTRYKVRPMPGSSDQAGEAHFAVFGPDVGFFARQHELARTMQRALNAAPPKFTEREQDAIYTALALVECGEDPWETGKGDDFSQTMKAVKSVLAKMQRSD